MKKTLKQLKVQRVAKFRDIIMDIIKSKLNFRNAILTSREGFLYVFEDEFIRRITIQPHEILDAALFYLELNGYPIDVDAIDITEEHLVSILRLKYSSLLREELCNLELLEMVISPKVGLVENYDFVGIRKRDIIKPKVKDEDLVNILNKYNGSY